jgi:hypothetical protein
MHPNETKFSTKKIGIKKGDLTLKMCKQIDINQDTIAASTDIVPF